MADVFMKQGDLQPDLTFAFTDADGEAIDLTGATVELWMTPIHGTAAKIAGAACDIDSPATAGTGGYQWQAGDTDTPGGFLAEFRATWSGSPGSFPNDAYKTVAILPSLEDLDEEES